VLAGNGFPVLLTPGPTPTPVISYSVKANQAIAALNITASHNPPEDCGFKVRDRNGGAIAAGRTQADRGGHPTGGRRIRHQARISLAQGLADGRIRKFDPKPAYLAQIARPDRRDADQRSGAAHRGGQHVGQRRRLADGDPRRRQAPS
jgi:phosphomannomutase